MQKFLCKYKFIISLCLLFLVFLFKKGPFYLFFPLPAAEFDTYEYFQIVEHINTGTFISMGILPPGFIVFSWLVGLFSKNMIVLVFIQDILYFISLVLLFYTTKKHLEKAFWPIVIVVLIFILNFYNLRYDTKLYPDFLYHISLVYTTVFFIKALFSKTKMSVLIFSISLIFPALIRANGPYIYFLLVLLALFIFINKTYKKQLLLFLFLPFIGLNLFWAIYNKATLDVFKPGHATRSLKRQLCKSKIDSTQTLELETKNFFEKNHIKIKTLKFSISHIYTDKGEFYFDFLKNRFGIFYYYNPNNPNFNQRYWQTNMFYGSLVNLFTEDFFSKNAINKYQSYYLLLDHDLRRTHPNRLASFWFTAIYFFHGIYAVFVLNPIWLIWFLTIYLYSVFVLFKSGFTNINAFLIFCIANIHVLSVFALSWIGAAGSYSLSRYIHVSEFAVYLSIGLSFLIFDYKIIQIIEKPENKPTGCSTTKP